MARNPRKKRCEVTGCHSWAMHSHTRCRQHRDDELGPRGGGAPHRNLNALKTGEHTSPLPLSTINLLSSQIVRQPDQLPKHIKAITRSIQGRTTNPHKTLIALQSALSDLADQVASDLFVVKFEALLRQASPLQRAALLKAAKEQVQLQDPRFTKRILKDLASTLEDHPESPIRATPHPTTSDHDHSHHDQGLENIDD